MLFSSISDLIVLAITELLNKAKIKNITKQIFFIELLLTIFTQKTSLPLDLKEAKIVYL